VAPGSDPFGVGGDMPTGSGRDLLGTYGDADQDVDNAGFDATPSAIFGPSDMGGGGPPPAPPDDDDENPNDFGVPGGDAFDPDAQSTEDLFAGMGLESPGAPADDAFGPPAAAGNIQAETRVYEAPQHLVEQSKAPPAEAAPAASSPSSPTKSGGGFKMPRAVAMLWSVLWQVTVLGVFLVAAVVWARGGNVDDVKEGRLVRVVLYGGGSSQHGALEVHDVNVERMPVSADENLVVVTGRVTNTSEESLPVVVITAKLHDRTYAAQVGATFDVKRLHDAESVAALQRVAPAGGGPLGPHETGDFELLMLGAKDGDEAVLSVAQTAALLDLAPPPVDVEPEATKDAKTNGATDDKAGKKGAKAGKSKRKKGKKKARKRRKKASSDDDDDAS